MKVTLLCSIIFALSPVVNVISEDLRSQIPTSVLEAIPECTPLGTDPASLIPSNLISQIPPGVIIQLSPDLLEKAKALMPVCPIPVQEMPMSQGTQLPQVPGLPEETEVMPDTPEEPVKVNPPTGPDNGCCCKCCCCGN